MLSPPFSIYLCFLYTTLTGKDSYINFGEENEYILILKDVSISSDTSEDACALLEIRENKTNTTLKQTRLCNGRESAWISPSGKEFLIRLIQTSIGYSTSFMFAEVEIFEREEISGLIFGNGQYTLLLNDIAIDESASGGACALIEIVETETLNSLQKSRLCKGTDYTWVSPDARRVKFRLLDIAPGYSQEAKWANIIIFG